MSADSTPVRVYVYDLSNCLACQLSMQLTGKEIDGIWHTSVVVFGKEIFCGQDICETEPGMSHHGSPLRVIDMGNTEMNQKSFEQYLTEIKDLYTADKYHLLNFNCNSFTNDCLGVLTGCSLPPYIKDLPYNFLSTPFGDALRPTIDAMFRGRAPTGVLTPPPDIGAAAAASPNPAPTSSLLQAVTTRAVSSNLGASSSSRNYLAMPAPTLPPMRSFGTALRPTIDAMFRGKAPAGVLTPPPDIGAVAAASPNPAHTSSLLQAVATGAASSNLGASSSSRNCLPTPAPISPPTTAPLGAALRPTIDATFRGRAPTLLLRPPSDIGAAAAASPNLALTSSLLQAVATRTASSDLGASSSSRNYLPTPAPTLPPTSAQNNPLTVPMHITTDPSFLNNVLRTHRAVVTFFTSAACRPCRTMEPVFEDLAISKNRANDVAFVKIDLSVGMGSAMARERGVRVTPTFIFFLDGKKIHEMMGVNAPELRTQVNLLIYQAFPPHPHTAISLPAIEAMSLNPIIFSQVPNLDTVLAKVTGFIDAASSWSGSTTKEDTKRILADNITTYLKPRGFSPPPIIPFEPWQDVTISLANNLSPGELFPMADIWRVALLKPAISGWSATKFGPESPVVILLSKAEGAPRNYTLVLLRMVSNAFSNKILARELLLSSRSSITAILVAALLHEDATVRTAAASLAFNMVAHLQRLRVEKVRGNSDGDDASENEDWEVEMTSVVLEAIEREKANEEIVHRLTASLALLVRLSPFLEQLTPLLDVLQARRILKGKLERGGCGDAGVAKKEVRKIIEEVAEKLCP